MKTIKILNPENASEQEIEKFQVREAVRAIVYDKDGNVAVLYVSKQNYHKLPGGGIEKGEDMFTALKRECQEEIGCDIDIHKEVGQVIEYRKMFQIKQTSTYYLADVLGEKGNPHFTQEEASEEFQIQWLSLEKAISILDSEKPLNDEGKLYIVPRDKTVLELIKSSAK